MLRLVLPKGSLERATMQLFEDADLAVNRASDVAYRASIDDSRIDEVRILRPQEIPVYVADGLFDLGITGRDCIEERGSEVVSLGKLAYSKATGNPARVLNDVDAAGMAEMTFGAGVDEQGTVLMVTFGTGIGSAVFTRGVLVPNTEFGHIEIHGTDAEKRASERAKVLHDLSWGKWAGRVDEYLQHVEALLSPHLIIVGGGISKEAEKWVPRLTGIRARIVPAALLNNAGIVGAAMATATEAAPDTSGATGTGH